MKFIKMKASKKDQKRSEEENQSKGR